MSSAMVSQTVQGTILSIISNVLAQIISSYKQNTPLSLNLAPIIKFAIFSIISNPPNIIWQTFLEDLFPTNVPVPAPKSEKANGKPHTSTKTQMSKGNILIKFILDQTFGAVLNNLMFVVYIGYVNAPVDGKLGAWGAVQNEVRDKFWAIMMDGYKLWPAVSLISFLFVPLDKRVLFGCLVGVGWNIYLSLMVES